MDANMKNHTAMDAKKDPTRPGRRLATPDRKRDRAIKLALTDREISELSRSADEMGVPVTTYARIALLSTMRAGR